MNVVVGVIACKRRRMAVVPPITAAPAGTWAPLQAAGRAKIMELRHLEDVTLILKSPTLVTRTVG
jgi:hypothetical protein